MDLLEFIEDAESRFFRTGHDTGANPCALSVWNHLRSYAGLEDLTQHDLMMKHAEDKGWTEAEVTADYAEMKRYREWQRLKHAEREIERLKKTGDFPAEFDWRV